MKGQEMDLFCALRKVNILLVDDDKMIRHSMALFFELERCRFSALESAEQGLEALKKRPYHIIIADYRLPGMDGIEFLRRSRTIHPHAITILITAYGSEEIFARATAAGIHEFIRKPFTAETFEDSLSGLLTNYNRNRR